MAPFEKQERHQHHAEPQDNSDHQGPVYNVFFNRPFESDDLEWDLEIGGRRTTVLLLARQAIFAAHDCPDFVRAREIVLRTCLGDHDVLDRGLIHPETRIKWADQVHFTVLRYLINRDLKLLRVFSRPYVRLFLVLCLLVDKLEHTWAGWVLNQDWVQVVIDELLLVSVFEGVTLARCVLKRRVLLRWAAIDIGTAAPGVLLYVIIVNGTGPSDESPVTLIDEEVCRHEFRLVAPIRPERILLYFVLGPAHHQITWTYSRTNVQERLLQGQGVTSLRLYVCFNLAKLPLRRLQLFKYLHIVTPALARFSYWLGVILSHAFYLRFVSTRWLLIDIVRWPFVFLLLWAAAFTSLLGLWESD